MIEAGSFVDSVLARSRPTTGEEATALGPTTDELRVSTEAAARPAGEEASDEANEEANEEASGEASWEASGEASGEATADKKAWLRPTADELAALREAGLEPRQGVLGLFLCRHKDGENVGRPIVPPKPIELEGPVKVLADAMRDELATRLKEKGAARVCRRLTSALAYTVPT